MWSNSITVNQAKVCPVSSSLLCPPLLILFTPPLDVFDHLPDEVEYLREFVIHESDLTHSLTLHIAWFKI